MGVLLSMALPRARCEPRFAYRYQARKPATLKGPRRTLGRAQQAAQPSKSQGNTTVGPTDSFAWVRLDRLLRFLVAGFDWELLDRVPGVVAQEKGSVRVDGNRLRCFHSPASLTREGKQERALRILPPVRGWCVERPP